MCETPTQTLPWQSADWPRIASQLAARRHHAWLIEGPQGIGKWELALAIARARLCRSPLPDYSACGECASCRSLSLSAESETSLSHPDFVLLMPSILREARGIPLPLSAQSDDKKSASKEILVDDMRVATDALALSSHHAQGRVCVVYPAEAMNAITANTLLKTLEEPPGDTLFLLVTHQAHALLPTIRSRCLALAAPRPERETAIAWLVQQGAAKADAALALGLTGGSPMLAREVLQAPDLLAAAKQAAEQGSWHSLKQLDLKAQPLTQLIPLVQRWLCDVARVKSGGVALSFSQTGHEAALHKAAGAYSWQKLRSLERSLNLLCRQAKHPVNAGLMLESLLIEMRPASRI